MDFWIENEPEAWFFKHWVRCTVLFLELLPGFVVFSCEPSRQGV